MNLAMYDYLTSTYKSLLVSEHMRYNTYHRHQCLYQHASRGNVPEVSQDQGRIQSVHKMDSAYEVWHVWDIRHLCTRLDHSNVPILSLAHWHVSSKQSMHLTL